MTTTYFPATYRDSLHDKIDRVLKRILGPLGKSKGAAATESPLTWWNLGGSIADADILCAWQPKGAASLSASYQRIAGTGGYANIDPAVVGGIAPGFDTNYGWMWNGSAYLKAGFTTAGYSGQNRSAITRFKRNSWEGFTTEYYPFGAGQSGGVRDDYMLYLRAGNTATNWFWIGYNGGYSYLLSLPYTLPNDQVWGIIGAYNYMDQTKVGPSPDWVTTTPCEMYIGACGYPNTPSLPCRSGTYTVGIAFYNRALTEVEYFSIRYLLAAL